MGLLSWITKVMNETDEANAHLILSAMVSDPERHWLESDLTLRWAMDARKFDRAIAWLAAHEFLVCDPEPVFVSGLYRSAKHTRYTLTFKGIQAAQQPQH